MPYARVNAAQLYYEQHGRGPDLVFLHGAGGNHLIWWQQVAEFSRSYRCTTFDARGWGLSRGDMAIGRWSLGTDLVALLEHLGIESAHVVAQSMGGRSVAGLARLAPKRVRSLVLCGTTAGATNDRVRDLQDELRDERGDGGLREHALAPGFESENPGLALLYRQINALNPARPRGMLGRPPPTYRGSTHGLIAGLGVPVLYLVGEYDLITSPEMIREAQGLIPGAAFHQMDAAGHSCYFERAAEWNRVVGEFLARVDG
ncbi:MAG: alpha/beta fold hydrolase [Dehalococcoidia bacterium]|nr:alpha/beta fold hydrolase [Dehalococcoidia bacterium]